MLCSHPRSGADGAFKRQLRQLSFEEEVKDGDVHFNYRLMNGRATTRNAIKLLSAFGYDEDIIKGAGRRADEFLQTGQWK